MTFEEKYGPPRKDAMAGIWELQKRAWDAGQEAMREMAAAVRLEGMYTPSEYVLVKRISDAIRALEIE